MLTTAPVTLDRARIEESTEIESTKLNHRTPKSGEMYERARHSMVNGVPSSYQVRSPWPIDLAAGRGSRVWHVDGNEMNRGIFMTPGREEEWIFSVSHTPADVDQYVAVFAEMASDLTA